MIEPDLSRYDDVLALVSDHAAATPVIRLATVGGSAATGRHDEHSDLDVQLWAEGDPAPPYAAIRDLLLDRLTTHHLWERPADFWPDGARQLFVHLQPDAAALREPTRILDLMVHPLTSDTVPTDPRRHGTPIVLHDPDRILRLEHEDEEPHARARAALREEIAARRQTAEWLVRRALARGELAEAVAFHLRFAITPLVELLRMEHCPARHDFGLRYLDTDLPPGYAERIHDLLPGPDLPSRVDRAFAWQDELLATTGVSP